MKPLQVAVIGVGALGRHHARILSQMKDVELTGVADPNESQGRSVAESCGTEWFADYRSLLEQCEAVSLVVPTVLHHQIAAELFSHGKSILIEKPLTADVGQARELIELAKANDCVLQVGHVERFNPAYELAAEIIESPRYLRAERLSPFSFRSIDIGVVHDLMIHDLELILNLVDSPVVSVDATAVCVMSELEDSVQAHLKFANGCTADLTASRIETKGKRTLQTWSAQGRVELDYDTRQVNTYFPALNLHDDDSPVSLAMKPDVDIADLRERVFNEFIKVENLKGSDADALTAELSNFVSAVRNEEPVRVDGMIALRALEVAEQILEAVRKTTATLQENFNTQLNRAA